MARLIWTAIFAMFASFAVAAPFQATVTLDVEVRDGALDTDPVVATIEAGAEVTIIDCLLDQCLLNMPGLALKNAAWADDAAIVVNGMPAADYAAQQRRAATRVAMPIIVSRDIRTEGDSYMASPIRAAIQQATGRTTTTTAVGGSTMAEVADRTLLPENQKYLNQVTVFWDGSHNGMSDVSTYADELQTAIDALGHDRFLVLPALHGDRRDEVATEFKSRWPNNIIDWRDVLGDYDGDIPQDLLKNPEVDNVHISDEAHNLVAAEVAKVIQAKRW